MQCSDHINRTSKIVVPEGKYEDKGILDVQPPVKKSVKKTGPPLFLE
jgi:hypothetical protein